MTRIVTRIAPSPTGPFHIGTARTALFNYLFARRHGGRFLVRIEDTDRARSRAEYEAEILEGLAWLGLIADEMTRQSDRATRHAQLLARLIEKGSAYIAPEQSKIEPGREVQLVRLKNPGKAVIFCDEVRGNITFDTAELGDFVIARAPDDPLYHFAVVVDDFDAGVTHVIRGEDHISNTPRQILIQEALGAPRPQYVHLPLILDASHAKLSKRGGAVSVMEYRVEGILPEALVNYLALLGWSPKSAREDFSLGELVQLFTLEGVHKNPAIWDREKLLSVSQRWLRKLSDDEMIAHLNGAYDQTRLRKALPLLRERAHTFGEAKELLDGELANLFAAPAPSREKLLAKEIEGRQGTAPAALQGFARALAALSEDSASEVVKAALMPLAEAAEAEGKGGRGRALWPLRYALSGQDRSPDPFTLVAILGKKEAVSRIKNAIAILEG